MIASSVVTQQFELGQVVRHRTRPYRGVVVAFDTVCQAPGLFGLYRPSAVTAEPWYHVLVDEAEHSVYLSQVDLVTDADGQVDHPDVEVYFERWLGDRYLRNATAFPSPW